MTEDAARKSLTDSEKEQIKLSATYLNGIAIGVVLVGGVSIPVSILQNAQGVVGAVTAIGFSLLCLGLSPYVHYLAKRKLKELDK